MAHATAIYVNLPVKDIARSRRFWEALGFGFNEQFSDGKALQLVLEKDKIHAMLISRAYFQTFTNRPVANGSTTQVLVALEVGSRQKVDDLVKLVLENGGSRYSESKDHGWMYYDTFADPDGHQWELLASEGAPTP